MAPIFLFPDRARSFFDQAETCSATGSEDIEDRIDHLIRKNDLRVEFVGELPVIVLTDSASEQVRAWSNELECHKAAKAGERALTDIVLQWHKRPRQEQFHQLNAVMLIDPEPAKRILEAWRAVAGKEFRKRIEERLRNCKFWV